MLTRRAERVYTRDMKENESLLAPKGTNMSTVFYSVHQDESNGRFDVMTDDGVFATYETYEDAMQACDDLNGDSYCEMCGSDPFLCECYDRYED